MVKVIDNDGNVLTTASVSMDGDNKVLTLTAASDVEDQLLADYASGSGRTVRLDAGVFWLAGTLRRESDHGRPAWQVELQPPARSRYSCFAAPEPTDFAMPTRSLRACERPHWAQAMVK